MIRPGLGPNPSLCLCMYQIPYDVPLSRNTSSSKCCHTLAWLGSVRFDLRLYYTAPYQFSVSMFRAPVLSVHTRLAWAWLGSANWLGWARFGLNIHTHRKGHTISNPMVQTHTIVSSAKGCTAGRTRHNPCPPVHTPCFVYL